MVLNHKLLKNEYVYSLITRGLNFISALFQSVFIARFLGKELKGNYAYINSIISIGSIIFFLGLHQLYPYLKKKNETRVKERFTTFSFIWTILFGLIVVFISFVFSKHDIDITVALLCIPVMSYVNSLDYVLLIENPNKRNFYFSVFSIVEFFVSLVLFIGFESCYGWMVFLIAYIILVKSVAFTIMLRVHPLRIDGMNSILIECRKFGLFPMIALLLTSLNYSIDVLMLKRYAFIQIGQIGIYSIGIMIADKLALIPDTLKGVLASKLANGAEDHEVAKVCRISFASCLFAGLMLAIVGAPVIDVLYGNEYKGAYMIALVAAIGSITNGYFKLISQYNIIHKRQVHNVLMLSISIIINVIGNMALVPIMGIIGAAISTCVAHVVCSGVFIVYFSKVADISISSMLFIQKKDIEFVREKLVRRK